MNKDMRNKIHSYEYSRLPQMSKSYQEMQERVSEKFAQDNLGPFAESEHQKPYERPEDDYQSLESTYIPFGYPPGSSPIGPKYDNFPQPPGSNFVPSYDLAKYPPAKKGKGPVTEFFNCWTKDCLCKNQLKKYNFECTFPVISGPTIHNKSDSTDQLPVTNELNSKKNGGTSTASIVSSDYQFYATLKSPITGNKVDVTWKVENECSPCTGTCTTESIGYVSLSIALEGQSALTVNNRLIGKKYTWKIEPDSPMGTVSSRERGYLKYVSKTSNCPIAEASIENGGSGYHTGDVLTISGGTGATVTVADNNASGEVTSITYGPSGTGYSSGVKNTTGGSGTGCTLNVIIDGETVLHCGPQTNRNCTKVDKITLFSTDSSNCCATDSATYECDHVHVTYYGNLYALTDIAGYTNAQLEGGCSQVEIAPDLWECGVSMWYQYQEVFNCYGSAVPGGVGIAALPECPDGRPYTGCGLDTVLGTCGGYCGTVAAICLASMAAVGCPNPRDSRTEQMKLDACCPYQLI